MQETRNKNAIQPKLTDMNPAAMIQTNWKFVETLLKECKAKTKRMLVEKMGQEAVELGHGEATITAAEENTLIASLCDLLERIWSHGLQQKQGRSALWSLLVSYMDVEEAQKGNKPIDPNLLTPDLSSSTFEGDTSQGCPSGMQTWPVRRHRRKPSRGLEMPVLNPLPSSVITDIRNVLQMTEIKTDVGYARAFVRLALEKKVLSKHLKELMSNADLLRTVYKRYAFLRCEDEREQFLYHLLSLNAVDYYCFTNTFTATTIPYRILIFPRQNTSVSTSTANGYCSISGQLGHTDKIPIPKHTLDISIKHKNLGILTTLSIGHDNAGMSPKWLVEHVLVRNEVTSHTYRFPCGRWLGRNIDDGALERLLVAEMVPPTTDHQELMEKCRTPPRCRSPSMPRKSNEPRIDINSIREMCSDACNNLVKHFNKPEKERGSLTTLLCGEYGLVYCMEHVFQFGFRSARLFRNRFFVWDFLEKVQAHYESLLSDRETVQINQTMRRTMNSFNYVVTKINQASGSIGKDGRFQIFVCIGVRDRWLQHWIRAISKTPVTSQMYEAQSFLRDPTLVQFLIQILESLREFNFVLEASLIQGVEL
ncbi:hypothetical protein LSH36_164g02051 [Paralvinella palmiformis]|uniref:DENN domain-containing protein 5A n=1 Tax=Paralvinella palmiformis TaxID=53620 RepID=A0AAD9JT54_9ANNE|nr:hypothetical protein LSH36_164g02051 [Paralvinella palmiformis]